MEELLAKLAPFRKPPPSYIVRPPVSGPPIDPPVVYPHVNPPHHEGYNVLSHPPRVEEMRPMHHAEYEPTHATDFFQARHHHADGTFSVHPSSIPHSAVPHQPGGVRLYDLPPQSHMAPPSYHTNSMSAPPSSSAPGIALNVSMNQLESLSKLISSLNKGGGSNMGASSAPRYDHNPMPTSSVMDASRDPRFYSMSQPVHQQHQPMTYPVNSNLLHNPQMQHMNPMDHNRMSNSNGSLNPMDHTRMSNSNGSLQMHPMNISETHTLDSHLKDPRLTMQYADVPKDPRATTTNLGDTTSSSRNNNVNNAFDGGYSYSPSR
jgi:hypothetical protein